jgi:hypothetical protein
MECKPALSASSSALRFWDMIAVIRSGRFGAIRRPSQEKHEVAKHVACGRKAVQQKDRGSVQATGLAVAYFAAVSGHPPISDATAGYAPRGFDRNAEFVTAARITSTTSPGALTNGVWSTFSDRIRAPMRSAIKT